MANATFLYAGSVAGLAVAGKPGTNPDWHLTRQTLAGQPVQALALGTQIPVRALVSVPEGGLFHSANNGRDWMLTLPVAVAALLADPSDPDMIYAAPRDPATALAAVLCSTDGGLTWQPLAPLPAAGTRVRSLALTSDAAGGRWLWAGLAAGGVVQAAPGGEWTGLARGLDPTQPVIALATLSRAASDLVAATPNGLYRLEAATRPTDSAWKGSDRVWRRQTQAPAGVTLLLPIGRSATPGGSAALLALDSAGRLWRGAPDDAPWTALPLPDPADPATALAAHPAYPDRAYLGTAAGHIYETRNRGTIWAETALTLTSPILTLGLVVIK